MPALQTITFNGTSTSALKPEIVGSGCWRLRVPDSYATAMAANTTTPINLNFNFTIPTGYFVLVIGSSTTTIPGAANCSVLLGVYTSSTTIQLNILNTGAATPIPTSTSGIARMLVLRSNIKQSIINAV